MKKKSKVNYDTEINIDFEELELPNILEIQLGSEIIPLIENKDGFLEELKNVRNEIDSEFGLPLPQIRVRDNKSFEPTEYAILLNGTKEGGFKGLSCNQILCLDTGEVTEKISEDCILTKEPGFGLDALILDKTRLEEAKAKGYTCPTLEKVIRIHLTQIIESNLTLFLNQCMVNNLINKVRPSNPDVIDSIFFENGFSTSKMKKVLNLLLEEKVSIRDLNTILETIADYIETDNKNSPLFLAERVRERLAYQFLSEYVTEDNIIEAIRIGPSITENLAKKITITEISPEHPFIALDPVQRRELYSKISEQILKSIDNNRPPILICHSDIRKSLSVTLSRDFPEIRIISDNEVFFCKNNYSLNLIGEIND